MNVIYKYPLTLSDEQTVKMPVRGAILSVQKQGHQLCLWVFHDLYNVECGQKEVRTFRVIGTGIQFEEFQDELRFIGTVQDGPFVWHIFEKEVP